MQWCKAGIYLFLTCPVTVAGRTVKFRLGGDRGIFFPEKENLLEGGFLCCIKPLPCLLLILLLLYAFPLFSNLPAFEKKVFTNLTSPLKSSYILTRNMRGTNLFPCGLLRKAVRRCFYMSLEHCLHHSNKRVPAASMHILFSLPGIQSFPGYRREFRSSQQEVSS